MGRISNLYRVGLLCEANVESLARRGKSASNTPMALCVTVFRCFVKRSLESNSRPRYLMCGLQGMSLRRKRSDGGGGGAAFGEKYGCGFGDIHLELPFSKASM